MLYERDTTRCMPSRLDCLLYYITLYYTMLYYAMRYYKVHALTPGLLAKTDLRITAEKVRRNAILYCNILY